MTSLKFAKYWRNCVADSDSDKATCSKRELEELIYCKPSVFENGLLEGKITEKLFGKDKKAQLVEIALYPFVFKKITEHLQNINDGRPHIVLPVFTRANVCRKGRIYPIKTLIARDILEPLYNKNFSVGSMEELDKYLLKNEVPTISEDTKNFEQDWKAYVKGSSKLLESICKNWLESNTNYYDPKRINILYELLDDSYIINKNTLSATRHIISLYDHISLCKNDLSLFKTFTSLDLTPIREVSSVEDTFTLRLGHSGDEYPLVKAQRDALSSLMTLSDGEVLAVNGPPGTGKTTMLLSAVASIWVKAAIEANDPPFICATSANNQPVTNIIDAFEKNFSIGHGVFAGRWLPAIKSYGLYLPASYKEGDLSGKYQTRGFLNTVENADYVRAAKIDYLAKSKDAFPDLELTVTSVVKKLHEELCAEKNKLYLLLQGYNKYHENMECIAAQYRGELPKTVEEYSAQISEHSNLTSEYKNHLSEWQNFNADLSIFYSIFAFLPFVKQKLIDKSNAFFNRRGLQELLGEFTNSKDVTNKLDSLVVQEDKAKQLLEEGLKTINEWKDLLMSNLNIDDVSIPFEELDNACDKTIRFKLFQLATHYWEGRWLLVMEENIDSIEKDLGRTGSVAKKEWWRRRMMLTPCLVVTLFMLPSEFEVSIYDKSTSEYDKSYMYEFGDLLIIDEAGQVSPEVAGASFSLFKKALIIGDVQQIEPIWSIVPNIDIGNLMDADIVSNDDRDSALRSYEMLNKLGKTASQGSTMSVAQSVTPFHYNKDLERGMYLYEHYRCYDEIIDYCNKLCYKGYLIMKRQDKPKEGVFPPPMGYLHIDGICKQKANSRVNKLEAKTVASWIVDNQEKLIERYPGKSLGNIIGVVTPFSGQKFEIINELKKLGIKSGNDGITVGTIHALQGAERQIIIFSPTYSKHSYGRFIDSNQSMLNVAVSRAKDSFLVFGDMDVFELMPPGPSKLLTNCLYSSEQNELHYKILIREDLVDVYSSPKLLHNYEEHDNFLIQVLSSAKKEVLITSPWVNNNYLEKGDISKAIIEAVKRNVRIQIYTDYSFNVSQNYNVVEERKNRLKLLRERLASNNIELIILDRLHAKNIICDDRLLCIGSYNWFSANRTERYSNYEVSTVYSSATVNLLDEIEKIKSNLKERAIKIK